MKIVGCGNAVELVFVPGHGCSHPVAGLFVKLIRLTHDVGNTDLVTPARCLDLLERDGHRLLSVAQNLHHAVGDGVGKLLLLRLALSPARA
jgi:hypothetical protein